MTAVRPRGLVPGSGRRGKSRRLDRVVSVRVAEPLLAEVRRLAARDGTSAGEWMRRAIAAAAFEQGRPPQVPGYRFAGWQCAHLTVTAGMELGKTSCGEGCEMLPLYVQAAA